MRSIKFFVAAVALAAAPVVQGFELTSSDIQPGKLMPRVQEYKGGYGCDGGNTSPQLAWYDVPKDTKSFAITVYDPDAPTGRGWWHWILLDIPAESRTLPSNAGDPRSGLAPVGSVEHRNDFGAAGFGGACPPAGDKPHRYQFKVYALDVARLDVDSESSGAAVRSKLKAHELGVAELEALYQR